MELSWILLLGAVAARTWAWEFTSPGEFEGVVGGSEMALVAFIRPELAKCKALEEEWTSLATQSKDPVLAIDCTGEPSFCESHDVLSHPAIRAYLPDNTIERYRGPRKASSILSFSHRIRHQLLSPLTTTNLTTFLASDDFAVVLLAHVHPDDDDELLLSRFESAAHRLRDRFSFGVLLDDKQGARAMLRCQNNLDGLEFATAELGKVGSVEAFVRGCGRRLVGEMTRRTETGYMRSGKSLIIYFTPSPPDREAYAVTMRALAKKYAEYLSFVTVDTREYPEMVPALGHEAGATDVLSLRNPHNGQVFPYEGETAMDPAGVEAWIVEISQGRKTAWDGVAPVRVKGRETEVHDEL